jgi:fucose 4-O-acetylase-like acetyltransferase
VTRIAWVDRAKGIAILLVVLHHAIQFSAYEQWASETAISVNWMLQTFRMPLFFAMSGLFFRNAASRSWRWLLVNRVLPFLYLYGVWTALWNAAFELTPVEGINFGLRHVPVLFTDPGVGPWYILALAMYFLAAKVLSPLQVLVQLTIVAALAIPVATRLISMGWAWEYITMYSLAFFAGMHGQRLLMALADRTTAMSVAIAAGIWAVGTAAAVIGGWPMFIPLCAAGIALGVTLAAYLHRARILSWFGIRTLPIYLLHMPLIAAVYSIPGIRSLPASTWVGAGVVLCTWIFAVFASIGLWRIGRIVPGLFTAPWPGDGNATRTRRHPPAVDAVNP